MHGGSPGPLLPGRSRPDADICQIIIWLAPGSPHAGRPPAGQMPAVLGGCLRRALAAQIPARSPGPGGCRRRCPRPRGPRPPVSSQPTGGAVERHWAAENRLSSARLVPVSVARDQPQPNLDEDSGDGLFRVRRGVVDCDVKRTIRYESYDWLRLCGRITSPSFTRRTKSACALSVVAPARLRLGSQPRARRPIM